MNKVPTKPPLFVGPPNQILTPSFIPYQPKQGLPAIISNPNPSPKQVDDFLIVSNQTRQDSNVIGAPVIILPPPIPPAVITTTAAPVNLPLPPPVTKPTTEQIEAANRRNKLMAAFRNVAFLGPENDEAINFILENPTETIGSLIQTINAVLKNNKRKNDDNDGSSNKKRKTVDE